MASTLITLLTLSILAISATARPCKTLFISSYSVSLRRLPSSSSSSGFVTVVTEIRQLRPIRFFYDDAVLAHPDESRAQPQRTMMPLLPLSTDLSSLRDRTKDILSVVVALLFGVGCGSLTAATMYLAWSLFSSRHSFDDEDVSPKKMGYVMIPEVVAAAPVKEASAQLAYSALMP
ncbi:hypothetical protein ACLB2K_007324 [Fragaria x ananassa]